MSSDWQRLVHGVPIFGGLSPETLAQLVDRATPHVATIGSYFMREGDTGTSVFVLERGRAAVLKNRDGQEHLLGHLGVGDCFGEVALLDFGPRSASVRAEKPCSAIEIRPSDLLEVAKRDMEQFAILHMNLARELSRRLRQADDRAFDWWVGGRPEAPAYDFHVN
ncbi:MAG: cyclic nucleotide-binding domain-containing protein [Myxococcota bacterium]|nr:cyclic nucleotide-binding domain-containing protein [Myxococcota bacterium]